jgi:O-antigen/teichoic acid export membrane protein
VAFTRVLALQVAAALVALLTQWLISLRVEPAAYGRYSLYLSVVSLSALVVIGWPNAALLRYGREEWSAHGRLGETLAARLAIHAATLALVLGAAWGGDVFVSRFLGVVQSPLPLIALGILLVPAADLAVYAHLAIGRTLAYGYVPLLNRLPLLIGVLTLAFWPSKAGWRDVALWQVSGAALSVAVAVARLPRGTWQGLRVRWSRLRSVVTYSWSVPLGALAGYTVNWVDAWVLRGFMGPEAVGIYTWAYQVTALGGLVFAALGTILTPSVLDARLRGEAAYLRRYGWRCARLVALSGIAGLALLPLVYPALTLAAGPTYQRSYHVLIILMAAIPFQLASYLVNPIVMSYEHLVPRVMLVSVGVGVANVVGDVLAVPILGIEGPAVVTLAVLALATALQVWLVGQGVPGVDLPRLHAFVGGGVLMAVGVVALAAAGPLWGGALALAGALLAAVVARRAGLFVHEDVVWLERQPLPAVAKRSLVAIARWLAGGEKRLELFSS